MAPLSLRGVFTALVTPFRNGAVDEAAFERLVKRQLDGGVHGLVPVGTTGETATLSHEEHRRVVELCVAIAARGRPVIAGAGSNSTEEAIELVRHAKAVGADAALVVTPYYNRPSQEGMYLHFKAINDAVDLPVLVYNVPGRTGVDISDETLARLAVLPNIVGVKDATGEVDRVSRQINYCGPDWVLLSGDDPTGLGYVAHGGHGCISVTSNVAPADCAAFYDACLSGDWAGARSIQARLIRLHKALFSDASPSPTKFALSHLGHCEETCRLPIAPCSDVARKEVLAALAEASVTG
jgi:4-hydroxy-tetrahydrodipicolinate synthase